jgi:hypothetical protein
MTNPARCAGDQYGLPKKSVHRIFFPSSMEAPVCGMYACLVSLRLIR